MSEEKIHIPLNKNSLLFGIIGSLVFVVLGNWLIINAEVVGSSFSKEFILGVGLICSFFFAGFAVLGLIKYFSKKPGLIIDQNGITDQSHSLSIGFVDWEDIEAVRLTNIHHTSLIIIEVKDHSKYLQSASKWKKRILKANILNHNTPVVIISKKLKINPQELFNLLNQKQEEYA